MMDASLNNSAEQNNLAEDVPASLGKSLREARERLGMSVADVANQIKFATRQIEALEADNFRQLQGATFLRGFVRSYAKILHLDALPLLEKLPLDKPLLQPLESVAVAMSFPSMLPSRRQNLIWSGAALLLAVIVVIFGLWQSAPQVEKSAVEFVETPVLLPSEPEIAPDSGIPELRVEAAVPKLKSSPVIAQPAVEVSKPAVAQILPAAQSPKPAVPSETSQVNAASKTSALRLVFGDESWTEIKDVDGKILSSQVNQPGSELRLKGHPPFAMLIGRALSVRLYQDDEQVDLTPYINKYSEVAHLTLE